MDCEPDFRDEIAASWPESIDDTQAQKDWGWSMEYDLDSMSNAMILNLREKLATEQSGQI